MLTIFGESYNLETLKAAWPVLWDTAKTTGNPYLKTDAFTVTVFPICYGRYIAAYKALIVLRGGRKTYTGAYPTAEAAKEAAFGELFGFLRVHGRAHRQSANSSQLGFSRDAKIDDVAARQ
jgi:hypothetical protein